jgi:hypothetical protein
MTRAQGSPMERRNAFRECWLNHLDPWEVTIDRCKHLWHNALRRVHFARAK